MLQFESFIYKKRYQEFTNRLLKVAKTEEIGPGIVKIIINPDAKRTICFVAGIHGNEPGGPFGVLEFLEDKIYVPKTKRVIIIPVANPTGFEANTRENNGKDMNRHFMDEKLTGDCKIIWDNVKNEDMEILHTLHEDPDMKEFYVYCSHNKPLAEDLRNLAKKYFKIFTGKELYDDKVEDGIIPLPHVVRGTLEDLILQNSIPYITTETPGLMPLEKRAEYTKNAMKMVIHAV